MFCALSANSEDYKSCFWTKKCVVHASCARCSKVGPLCTPTGQKDLKKRKKEKKSGKKLGFHLLSFYPGTHRDAGARKKSCLCVGGRSQAASGPNDLILLPSLWNQFKWKTVPAPIQKLWVALVKPFPPPSPPTPHHHLLLYTFRHAAWNCQ